MLPNKCIDVMQLQSQSQLGGSECCFGKFIPKFISRNELIKNSKLGERRVTRGNLSYHTLKLTIKQK